MIEEDVILAEFGKSVQKARSNRGWSQEKLAEYSALDRTYVSSVERGQRNISLINIYKLAAALEIAPARLLQVNGGSYE